MPHDRFGRAIEIGDFVLTRPYNHSIPQVVGRVIEITEAKICSGRITWPTYGGCASDYFGAAESELVCKSNGMVPRIPQNEEMETNPSPSSP